MMYNKPMMIALVEQLATAAQNNSLYYTCQLFIVLDMLIKVYLAVYPD
jgi:hypothetical protein